MKVLEHKRTLCLSCMTEHEVQTVELQEENIFKDTPVEYLAHHFYCDRTDELFSDEDMLQKNDKAMKDAYRQAQGLLTSSEIQTIRKQYCGISQVELSRLLDFGDKTITRYEGHQVQDFAHNAVLERIRDDPAYFLTVLEIKKDIFPTETYLALRRQGETLFEAMRGEYLKKSILAEYALFCENPSATGNRQLSLDVVGDVIRYFSNSESMASLHKLKLMQLLWYSDMLSCKRRGHAMTGLVYFALEKGKGEKPLGAIPLAHDDLIKLPGVEYEIELVEDTVSYHLKKTKNKEYSYLQKEDTDILDTIARIFSQVTGKKLLQALSSEPGYQHARPREVIGFEAAEALSID